MTAPQLELVGLRRHFDHGSVAAVDGIDLVVGKAETIALLGPSGCGKSTTLNMIAGLEHPTSGDIRIEGASIVATPPGKRNVGLVFQDYAVFTHMTVWQNLAFGLSIRRRPKAEIARAVSEIAELLGMTNTLHARAVDLGGSELQRVAIGRTLLTRPAVLLLDEPLSNLEPATRATMRRELRRLQADIGLTIIYVTHDQIEALSLADSIAVMNAGKIVQTERTEVICGRPDHVFVAGFLGSPPMNLLRGQLQSDDDGLFFRKDDFFLRLPDLYGQIEIDAPIVLGIRAEAIAITSPAVGTLSGRVLIAEPRGPDSVVTVECGEVRLKAIVEGRTTPADGAGIGLVVDDRGLVLFSGETGRRLDVRGLDA